MKTTWLGLWILLTVFIQFSSLPLWSQTGVVSRFLYETDSDSTQEGIGIYRVWPQVGRMTLEEFIPRNNFSENGPFDPVVDPLGRFLYTLEAYENLDVWGINPRTGALTLKSSTFAGFLNGNIAIHPSGNFLYTNDEYTDEAAIHAFGVAADGTLNPINTYFFGLGSYSLVMHPSGKFIYVQGDDNNQNPVELIFSVDQATGALTELSKSFYVSPILSFVPDGKFGFADGAGGIDVFRVNLNTGYLSLVAGSPFPSLGQGGVVSPNGQYYYQSVYGVRLLEVFSIDPLTGALTQIPGSPFQTKGQDVLAAIDPSGRYAYFVDYLASVNDIFALDPRTGAVSSLTGSTPANREPFSEAILAGSRPVNTASRYFYTANKGSNDITGYLLNSMSGMVAPVPGSPFPAGGAPAALAGNYFSPFLYAVNSASNNVFGFKISSQGSLTAIPGSPYQVGANPVTAVLNPSGSFLYVSNSGDNTVSIFSVNPHDGSLLAKPPRSISGKTPASLATDAAGNVLFVGNTSSNSISVYNIDVYTGTLAEASSQGSPVAVGFAPQSMVSDPTGLFLYVIDQSAQTVNAYTEQLDSTLPMLKPISGTNQFPVGSLPGGLAVDPTGQYLYVANSASNNISAFVIDVTTGGLAAVQGSPFQVGSAPSSVKVDPSGKFVLVTNSGSNNVSILAIETGGALIQIIGSPFPVGSAPAAIDSSGVTR